MFDTKSGKAQWEIVTEILKVKNVGDIATYEELLNALGSDFPRASLSAVVWSAIRKFRDNKRTFENVRKVGWRMVEATEHSRLARKQQLRGKRRLADAVSISASTDLSKLDPDQRRFQRAQELALRQMHAQLSRRIDRIDQRVGVVEKGQLVSDERVEGVSAEVSRLKDLLGRHGIVDDQ